MTDVRDGGDPRLQTLFGLDQLQDTSVRPTVRLPKSGPSTAVLAGCAAIAAILLFWALESRRTAPVEPSVRMRAADGAQSFGEAPPLYIPPVMPPAAAPMLPVAPAHQQPMPAPRAFVAPVQQSLPRVTPQPVQYAPPPPQSYAPPPVPQNAVRSSTGSALLVDSTTPSAPARPAEAGVGQDSSTEERGVLVSGRRMRASSLANRSMTVPQGMMIAAVLETALDSTRPGFVRAIVSRDIRGFDGSRVLVPRGSRLLGDYRSETAAGQKRAMITWTRLIRPDGVTIRLDSPAVDPLGRSGVPASVNTHFWERFSGALLQSTLDIGRTVAGRGRDGSVVVALPGSVQNAISPVTSNGITPTLRVPAGKSISVFVAHDLEFSDAGR